MTDPDVLTVARVLELEIFRRGGATVVGATDHLDNVVTWVHSAEISDIARFLGGGELLLTAGLGIGDSETDQRDYIRSLAGAGVAMLGVEVAGRRFDHLPPAMVEEARAVGLPIVTFEVEVPFVEVASQVHGCIVDLRVRRLLNDEAVNEAFTELLLRGEDHVSMVSELGRQVSRSCVLEDKAHQLAAYSHRTEVGDAAVAQWSAHSWNHHNSGEHCTRIAVALRGEIWGWVHVIGGDEALSSAHLYAANRACAAIAITLLSEQVRGARRSQRHAALLNRLMLTDISGAGFVERALRLGRDIRGKAYVAVVVTRRSDQDVFGEAQLSACLSKAGIPALVAETGATVTAVLTVSSKGGMRSVVQALQATPTRCGLSRVVSVDQLALAVKQANQAFAAATASAVEEHLVKFDDLGVFRLLILLAQGPELASYVEDELGRVLEHDSRSANKLFPTLRTYLECDGRKSEAADALFIQRRTLYYRLDRLNSLLQHPLDDSETRLRLLLAVRGLDLLERRTRGSEPDQ